MEQSKDVQAAIVYDDNVSREDLATGMGFSCVVSGLERTILFDTGGSGSVLLDNMRRLGLDAQRIDVVVLSHSHGDHIGGLRAFLGIRTGIPVYVPSGFPTAFSEEVRALGSWTVRAAVSEMICPGALTTGTLRGQGVDEQALCIHTDRGWMLMTGCAHPGVVRLAERASEITDEPVSFVMGGFHMKGQSKAQIQAAAQRLEELGVQGAAPCHCTGRRARRLFQQHFGDGCVLPGVGHVMHFAR